MTTPTYKIGADVFATDGRIGQLSRVAVDPRSKRVTDLIVEKGRVLKEDRVIPVEAVERVDDDGIYLAVGREEVDAYPAYHEADFTASDRKVRQEMGYHKDESLEWVWRYGVATAAPFVSSVKERVGAQTGAGGGDDGGGPAVIGRGSRVYNDEGTIGAVHHLLLDQEAGELRYLVVRRGLLPFRAVIPAEMVGRFEEDGVYVSASREELEELARYAPRPDADIQDELEERLADGADEVVGKESDFGRVRVRLKNGLARLAGSVRNVLDKQRAQEVTAEVPGVVGVENELITDDEVAARVLIALLEEPLTELCPIDVDVDQGRVTLRGRVDGEAAREAAVSLTREQPGVRGVVDELVVAREVE